VPRVSTNPFSYAGKRVVVTGAASGVGADLVPLLAELGAEHITTVDRNPTSAGTVNIQADLSTAAGVDDVIGQIDGRVDVLFNNAGVAANMPIPVLYGVNVLAPRRLAEGLLPQMPEGGSIVYTASMAGNGWPPNKDVILELLAIGDWDKTVAFVEERAEQFGDLYNFTKQVMQVHTMQVSKSTIAKGVRSNSVCPGLIQTPLMVDFRATMGDQIIDWTASQTGGMATPRQIADVLAFVGSDASSFLNGTNLLADGGFTAALTTNQLV
jgi:NAD(P)-dependent dehydrogenase (short-subunit alcohol dehydrogenase family)